jgi:antitoxin YefM
MGSLNASDARKGFFDLLKGASERHEIYHIQYKSGNAVLLSEEEFESLLETLELLSSTNFRKGFKTARKQAEQGDTLSFEEVFGEKQ